MPEGLQFSLAPRHVSIDEAGDETLSLSPSLCLVGLCFKRFPSAYPSKLVYEYSPISATEESGRNTRFIQDKKKSTLASRVL